VIPNSDLAGLAAAHQGLLRDLSDLTSGDVGAPSRLPGWSVGHVLTHLARNADGFTRMVLAAAAGRVGHQYPGGVEQRARDIEAGARRPASDQIADIERSIAELTNAFARLDDELWRRGVGVVTVGERRLVDMPFRRWREVEVHHVDLGRPSFTFTDWSAPYVERELAETLGAVADRLPGSLGLRIEFVDVDDVVTIGGAEIVPVRGTRREVLAWLIGRADRPDVPELGPWL
jgi:maleylpyruvate isomerase